MSNSLAIVIPAYRRKYLRETLQSLANQTNKDFNLYLVDDASPDAISSIIGEFEDVLSIKYVRFDVNYGSISLVNQWKRAISVSQNENWIWLLCDDDTCDKNCVEAFKRETEFLHLNKISLFRFATRVIDEKSAFTTQIFFHPDLESGIDFIKRKINGETRSTLSEYIFQRKAYETYTFLDFPLAWHSDDVAWIAFSHPNMIKSCNEAVVNVRISSDSITGSDSNFNLKRDGTRMFVEWLLTSNLIDRTKMSSQNWLNAYYIVEGYYVNRHVPFGISDFFMLWKLRVKCVGMWKGLMAVKLLKLFLPSTKANSRLQ